MPKYEIPKFSTEELLAAFGSQVSPGGVIKAGKEGLKYGADLASTIAETKGKKLKQQQEIEEIERKLAAQELLAKTVEGKPEMERKKLSLQPLAPKPLPVSPIQLTERVKAEGPATAQGETPEALVPGRTVTPMQQESPEYKQGVESIQEEERKRKQLADIVRSGYGKEVVSSMMPSEGTKRYQSGTAEVNGQILNVTFDTFTGKYLDNAGKDLGATVRGYKPDIKTNPIDEQLWRFTTGGVQTPIGGAGVSQQEIQFPEDLTVRQSNRLNELSKRFEDDDVVKSSRISMLTLQNLATLEEQGTGAIIGSLQSLRARGLAGEKGVLTEKDVERATGSPQLSRRFMNAVDKLLLNYELPENKAEFKAALQAVQEAAAIRNKQVENEFIQRAKSTKELSNVSPDLIKQNISIGTQSFQPGPVVKPTYNSQGGMTPEKKARLEELRAKKAAGTLR